MYYSLSNGKKSIAGNGEKKGFGAISAAGNIQTGVSTCASENVFCKAWGKLKEDWCRYFRKMLITK